MTVEGFVCWTARSAEEDAELRRTLEAQLPAGDRALADAQEAGLLEGTRLCPPGLAAAQRFAERGDLPLSGPRDAIADFGALVEALAGARERGRPLGTDAVPDGFDAVSPTVDRYDRRYHTINVARTYPSGATVELNYRSRDPSHPREPKPNESSAVLWLDGDGDRTHEHRVEWIED